MKVYKIFENSERRNYYKKIFINESGFNSLIHNLQKRNKYKNTKKIKGGYEETCSDGSFRRVFYVKVKDEIGEVIERNYRNIEIA